MHRRGSGLAALLLTAVAAPAAAQEIGHGGVTSVFGPPGLEVLSVPSDAEVVASAPRGGKSNGSAVIHCKAAAAGSLSDCQLTREQGAGFGAALIALAPKYRVELPKEAAEGATVAVAASWPAPDTPADWRVQPKAGDFAITYTEAAWRSGKPGYAVMNCQQGAQGDLRQCMVIYQDPAGKGFGTMLLAFQAYLKLKPATLGGKPISSAVNVGFHFAAHIAGEPGKLP
jgi:GNAT superfamily N-acetyltransferase